MIYTDAHCHIDSPKSIPNEILGRIYNATHESDWNTAISISENDDDTNFAAIGIHPWYIANISDDWATRMTDILVSHPNLMVGEIGLDKLKPHLPRQIEIFTIQLEIAARTRRPVHIHCVGAWDKILHVFKTHEKSLPPVIIAHAYSGHENQIEYLATHYNMYFSYSEKSGENANVRISTTPMDRILTESDAFNSDEEIRALDEITHTIAYIHDIDITAASEQINQNLQRVISYVRPIN